MSHQHEWTQRQMTNGDPWWVCACGEAEDCDPSGRGQTCTCEAQNDYATWHNGRCALTEQGRVSSSECRGYPDEDAACTACGRDEDAHIKGRSATPRMTAAEVASLDEEPKVVPEILALAERVKGRVLPPGPCPACGASEDRCLDTILHGGNGDPCCNACDHPQASETTCYCGDPGDRESVHRAHACASWVSRG